MFLIFYPNFPFVSSSFSLVLSSKLFIKYVRFLSANGNYVKWVFLNYIPKFQKIKSDIDLLTCQWFSPVIPPLISIFYCNKHSNFLQGMEYYYAQRWCLLFGQVLRIGLGWECFSTPLYSLNVISCELSKGFNVLRFGLFHFINTSFRLLHGWTNMIDVQLILN